MTQRCKSEPHKLESKPWLPAQCSQLLSAAYNSVIMQTTENELEEKSRLLEQNARKNLDRDRMLLAQAPPKDWESIAREGAKVIQEAWNKSEGLFLLLICAVNERILIGVYRLLQKALDLSQIHVCMFTCSNVSCQYCPKTGVFWPSIECRQIMVEAAWPSSVVFRAWATISLSAHQAYWWLWLRHDHASSAIL